ncbi:hypothetical protein SHIRM173S_08318 [Streptomyces hirsutus]
MPLTFLSYSLAALPTSPILKPRFFSSSAVFLARPDLVVALRTLTVIRSGPGSAALGLGLGEGLALVAQPALTPTAEAGLPPPVKTSKSCSVPQPATPSAATEVMVRTTSLPRRRGRRIRGYLSPRIWYWPPMPGGVSMLMGAA